MFGVRNGEAMKPWSKHPVIYEINTWVWLWELSRKYQRAVNLATVPELGVGCDCRLWI